MKVIAKPSVKVRDVFLECISTVDNVELKHDLAACVNIIETAEDDFESKFPINEIYTIPQNSIVLGRIGKAEMKSVYDYRMVKAGMPAHKYYNKIKSSAPYGKCPLCSVRGVDTLDHYLPKSKYPVFSVTPVNLIPACIPCNKRKHIDFPRTGEEQTLHPYYDDIENYTWLWASVLQTNPISFNYYVNPPDVWPKILKDRTLNHFASFNLNELFSSHASEELRGAINQLTKLYNENTNLLTLQLRECYNSRSALGLNSWQAVMYRTLLNDVWFCTGGILT